jgi:hypothetical protein
LFSDTCIPVYVKDTGKSIVILIVKVDDILIADNDVIGLSKLKEMLYKNFQSSDLGQLRWFLGIHIEHKDNCIEMNKNIYVDKILKIRYSLKMSDCKTKSIPCDPSSC